MGDSISGWMVEKAMIEAETKGKMKKGENITSKKKKKWTLNTSVAKIKKMRHFLSKAFSCRQNRSKGKKKADKNRKGEENPNIDRCIAQHNNEGIRHPCKYRRTLSNGSNLTQEHMSGSEVKDKRIKSETKLIIDGAKLKNFYTSKMRKEKTNKYQNTKVIKQKASWDTKERKENKDMKHKKTKVWKRNEKKYRKQGLQKIGKVSRFLYKICKKPENYEALKGIVTQRKGYRRLERENYVALEGKRNNN